MGRFSSSAEAHGARLALDAAGIEAVVGDDATADMLSIMATGLGGAKLLVAARNAGRAKAILEHETREKLPPLPGWICHQCGSTVDSGFELCWSCGAAYDCQQSLPAPLIEMEEDDADDASLASRRQR